MKKNIILGIGLIIILFTGLLWFLVGVPKPQPVQPTYSDLPYIQATNTAQAVLFSELVDAAPDASFQAVLDLLYLDIYETYQCPTLGGNEQTLLITAKYTPNADGLNTLDEAKRAVATWESLMLVDVGQLLFPSISVSERNVPLTFAAVPGTSMRTAKVTIDDAPVTIAYSWLLNFVLISTSLDCLQTTMEDVYEHDI